MTVPPLLPSRSRGPIALVRGFIRTEQFRFLLIGVVNTVVGFALFAIFEWAIGRVTSYFVSLYGSYLIATIIAFSLHRRFTFRVTGRRGIVLDFVRYQAVTVVSLAVNTVALPVLVEFAHLAPVPAQAIIVVITTIVSYLGHKFFSFRRAAPRDDAGSSR